MEEPATVEEVEDFENTCKIKDDDRINVDNNNNQYFNEALAKYQPK